MTLQRLSLKHLKSLVWLLIITALIVSGGVIFAQEEITGAPWSVFVPSYATEGETMEIQLHQVNADGSQVTHTFPPDIQNGLGSQTSAFSPDESRLALCAAPPPPASTDPNAAPVAPSYSLTLYDLAAQSSALEVPLGEIVACTVTPDAFSQDGSRVAVGVITQWPAGPETPQPESTWQLIVVDTTSGETVATLDAFNSALSALGVDTSLQLVMPFTRHVEGNLVYFALVNWFTEALPSYDAFVWNTADNTVEEAPLWGNIFGGDQIMTADGLEFSYTMLDENQPAANPGGPMAEANVVVVQREGGEPQVIYTNTEEVITGVRYINDGNALAIGLLAAFDPSGEGEMPGQQPVRYIMLTRDGTVTELVAPIVGQIQIQPIPGGYVNFTSVYDMEANIQNVTLEAVTAEGSTSLLPDEGGVQWSAPIYATSPDLSGVSLPEFTPAASS
jgi:hypothetical protein